ncbi:SRPBCC domain-containing protein [Chromobacterium piscinae]|uniref:SRPBCC domain-containing protein n=1 Tax=Chromobacterium piscinae TaxID=686831 RepID=A0ABV0H3S5_9NEIS|nr:SRPBCC domain-containing protein [Chromobacterium piscinae]MBX9299185.1 SRPBCC domain-containing protein [Chromobacterium vaccinii]MBX9350000.1 SRPBCC domain-containing protein [Chromobacterium vaccinii]MBX9355329.1 SRPBCC domain-containing protein [Chromobacterium vaccinii]MCD4504157.1 SRPBCC domain-containing protein [Chromobacterium piscinae]MCD5327549.1 SRPBCC domain-containing protein [Chromobacterium piscinae]
MTTFTASREIPASREQVFSAISSPERLARWWGPAGFSNTFDICELQTGGRWVFTMHGPDGMSYPNESVFAEVTEPERVVVQHVSSPEFRLTIALEVRLGATRVLWSQQFEDAGLAERMSSIVIPANEQNLKRLEAEVLGR